MGESHQTSSKSYESIFTSRRVRIDTSLGQIRCRLKEHSTMAMAFGRKISSLKNPRFFSRSKVIWEFDKNALAAIADEGRFRAPVGTEQTLNIWSPWEDEVNIKFGDDNFSPEGISGSLSR